MGRERANFRLRMRLNFKRLGTLIEPNYIENQWGKGGLENQEKDNSKPRLSFAFGKISKESQGISIAISALIVYGCRPSDALS